MFPEKISKRKKRGIIVLISVLAVIILFPRFYMWTQGSEPIRISIEELNRGVSELESKRFSSIQQKQGKKKNKYHSPTSKFDPNEYTSEDWMTLGLSEKQARVVVQFAQRGIRSNDQLKQIFVIDETLFELIKDSTFYPEKKEWNRETVSTFKAEKPKTDINTATEEELRKLYGIGDYFSKKIVEYREKLGGFISEEQLLEIYYFDQEKLDKIIDRIKVSSEAVKRININTCTTEELAKHPYISWNVANSIVKMRTQHGEYTNFDQLLKSELIDKTLLEKITPYLTV